MHPLSWLLGVWKSFYHHWKDLLELYAKSSMKYSFYQSPLCQQQNKRTLISSDDEDIQWENGTANVTLEGLVWLADYSLYWGGFFGPWIFSHVSGNKNERLSFLENNLPYTNLHIRELDHRIPLSLARLRFTVRLLDVPMPNASLLIPAELPFGCRESLVPTNTRVLGTVSGSTRVTSFVQSHIMLAEIKTREENPCALRNLDAKRR